MSNWVRISLPYGKSADTANRIQLAFEAIWKANKAPAGAALFTAHDHSHEYEHIYFSPEAAALAANLVSEFKGVACSAPAREGTILLVGRAGARSLLPEGSDSD